MDKAEKGHSIDKPIIGITIGDINGIGPEIIIKSLSDARLLRFFTPVIYGSSKVLSYYKKAVKANEFNYTQPKSDGSFNDKKINVVNCWNELVDIQVGAVTKEAGHCAFLAIQQASDDLKAGHLDAIVTAPINKSNIQGEDFQFPGHTEYFTQKFNAPESLMLLVSGKLRVGVVTGHIPIKDVSNQLSKELIIKKLNILAHSLKKDFGILKPKIAVLGLNPHAGEEGLLGDEEKDIVTPAINVLKEKGKLVFGPFPADGFFGMAQYKNFDAVLAMYHDQGLIPFKTLAFENGINFTAGLSAIRTSPDHGTAYDIAGKNLANETSFREALYLACDIIKNRKEIGEPIPGII